MTVKSKSGITLEHAISLSHEYQSDADSSSTTRAYATDWAAFEAWCNKNYLPALPATPETVGAYLASCGESYAMSTLRRRVAAIARKHRHENHPLDVHHKSIRETLRGIARNHAAPPKQAAALTTDEVVRLVEVCGDDLTGLRDKAVFLMGFSGAMRRSELVALKVSNVRFLEDSMQITIERSKTDAEAEGAVLTIARGGSSQTCPVIALQDWLKAAKINHGAIFRKVDRWGKIRDKGLVPDAVRQILKNRAAMAGIKGTLMEPISPHGLRAGFVTTAYRSGAMDEDIMGHTRHKTLATMRRYVRRSKLGVKSVSSKIGL